MGLPPVVVEISAADSTSELRGTLVDACSRAVLDSECVEGSSASGIEAGSAAAVAIVSWQPDGTVRIEVGLRPDEPWHTRILRFESSEEPAEVFTAVGFAIGALVGRLQEEHELATPESAPGPEPAEPAPTPTPAVARPQLPPQPPPVTVSPSEPSSWVASLAALAGTGRSWSSWQVGAVGSIAWAHPRGALFGFTGTYAVSPRPEGDPQVSWVGFGVGPGYEFPLVGRLGLVLGVDAGAEYHRAQVTLPESLRHAEASRVVGVGRLGIDLVGPAWMQLQAVVGLHVAAPFGATRISVAGVPEDEPAPVRLTGVLGVRYDGREPR